MSLLLARPEGTAHLDGHGGLRQVDGEVRHLAHDEHALLAAPEGLEEALALLDAGLARDSRCPHVLGDLGELVEVLADDEDLLVGMSLDELLDQPGLLRGCGRESIAIVRLGRGVDEALGVGEGDADLDALGRCDPALCLHLLPRGVVTLGADEREDVALATVLADECGGESEAASRLDVGCEAEDRRRQQMHLVVDDEAPVTCVEDLEVREDALPLGRHHLVRRDRDRPDLLAGT